MNHEIFSDGFATISVTGPIVRIDLMAFTGQDQDGKPRFEVRGRLVMPIDGFVRSFALAEETITKLKKAGILKQRPAEPEATLEVKSKG